VVFFRAGVVCLFALCATAVLRGQEVAPAAAAGPPFAADATGQEIYVAACATCHAVDGTGAPRQVVGFTKELPDFTDCRFATPEPLPDWTAVVHEGGPIRALDRHMPAFGEALSASEIDRVIRYIWRFCAEPSWPRGDLNFPRAFFTEKAFPENEAVLTTLFSTGGEGRSIDNELQFERRLGARTQLEVAIPFTLQHEEALPWTLGLADVSVGLKRALYASIDTGRIVSIGAEVALPTAKAGLSTGVAVFEPFVMAGQAIGNGGFIQLHAGLELPFVPAKVGREAFVRTAIGGSFAQDRGFGRAWTPIVEVLWARREYQRSAWDIVPQLQVSLSKLQHVLVSGGVRLPVNAEGERHPEIVTYFLWDWFDGSLFDFWK
jgi:mono/diheme cytochrome c family protein